MRHSFASTFLALTAAATAPMVFGQPAVDDSQSPSRRAAGQKHVRPTCFVENLGQAPKDVLWQAHGAGFEASFSRDGFVVRLFGAKPDASTGGSAKPLAAAGGGAGPAKLSDPGRITITEQRISLAGASPLATIEPLDRLPGRVSFFRGNNPKRWASGLSTYARLRYKNVYPGIDLLFYSNQGALEYDFAVAPGADPGAIRLRVEDGQPVRIENGVLQVGEGAGAVLHRPLLYQNVRSGKRVIGGNFVSLADDTVGFQFSQYDASRELVIDPALSLLYSTYLGGYHDDEATAIVLDAQNNSYILGFSQSPNYPVSGNAYQPLRANDTQLLANMVVTKISASGIVLYSTFLGGSTGESSGGIALDAAGNAYISGTTRSTDYPVTAGAYQGTYPTGASSSSVVSEISPDGSTLLYSTFFSGSGGGTAGTYGGIAFYLGKLYFAGYAGPGLPTTAGAYLTKINSGQAAFVAALNLAATGSAQLVAATYYGAANPAANSVVTGNTTYSMALDSSGNPWIAGQTWTNNLPTTANALQPTLPALSASCQGFGANLNSAAYIAKLSSNLTTLLYASYFSGQTAGAQVNACSEYAHAIALDPSGDAYIAGATPSATFPTTSGVVQQSFPGSNTYVGFVSKLSSTGTQMLWSSYIGGNAGSTFPAWLATDTQGNPWVGGITQGGANFPISPVTYQSTQNGVSNGFLTEFSSNGTQSPYSTYIGGSLSDIVNAFGFDAQNNVYVTGNATSLNFPVTSNAFEAQKADGGPDYNGADIFFLILGTGAIGVISPATGGNTGDTSVTISGAGLQAGASCSLVQGNTTIQSAAATVAAGGTSMTCTFALNGAATGSYNVVVNSPGGVSFTQTNAFTVTAGGSPQIWTNVVGRSKIRDGAPSNFIVTVGNSGTSDAYFTVLWILFPSTLTYSLNQPLIDPSDSLQTDYSLANAAQDSSGNTVMKYILPHLPPNSSISIGLALTAAVDTASIAIQSYAYRPWYDSYSAASADLTAAQNGGILSTTCIPNPVKAYLNDCLGPEVIELSQDVLNRVETDPSFPGNPSQVLVTLEDEYAGRLLSALNESVAGPPPAPASNLSRSAHPRELPLIVGGIVAAAGALAAVVQAWLEYEANQGAANTRTRCSFSFKTLQPCCSGSAVVELYLSCPNQPVVDAGSFTVPCDKKGTPKPPSPCNGSGGPASAVKTLARLDSKFHIPGSPVRPRDGESCSADDSDDEGGASGDGASCSGSGGSVDPNDKSGPLGDGSPAHYVKLSPLTYNVAFENQSSATLPASQVVVTDQLDPTKVDLTNLTLGSFAFGTNIITLPANTNDYSTTFNINSSLSVRMQGSLNSDTGLLKWTFTSIDPTTGLPPSDPTVGFLPPDVNGVEGQGSVQFSVKPIGTLSTGTQITNQANVVFDANAPILTPTWLNTIDVTLPTSAVTALPVEETLATFPVSWTGSDVGSGIASYSVYVSDNSGPFTAWLSQTTSTTASYAGNPGHTYGIYSIATDGAGNVQATKTAADTTTAVSAQAVSACSIGQGGLTNVVDVQLIINEALGVKAAADDLNGDGVVNIVDVRIDMNAALGFGCVSN